MNRNDEKEIVQRDQSNITMMFVKNEQCKKFEEILIKDLNV